jgi:hypothetical protein
MRAFDKVAEHPTPAVRPRISRGLALLASVAGILALGLWNLDGPPMWWDEGWTLSVARNWAERGFYGRLLLGQLSPPGLEASFWVTWPVSLGMRLFGVGLWQGRVFGVLCAAAALVLCHLLAARLYSRRVAIGALGGLLLLSAHPQLHPLLMGRQVLGEMPMLTYLLAGWLCLHNALRGRDWWLLPGALLFALAVQAKAQTMPFWLTSMVVALAVMLIRQRWRAAVRLALAFAGGLVLQPALDMARDSIIGGRTLPVAGVQGLVSVMALVTGSFNRGYALTNGLTFGVLPLLGLGWAAWRWLRGGWAALDDQDYAVRVSLLAFAGSWFAWYLLLSVGVPRYMFPATFVSSLFAAALLDDLTDGYRLAATLERAVEPLRTRRFSRVSAGAWLAILLIAAALPLTLLGLARYYPLVDRSAFAVAEYLNGRPPGTRIETYESELHFLLRQPYHFPPDQTHVALNRRSLLHEATPIDYDPLAANPDYLVIGEFARGNDLYASAVAAGPFRLAQRIGQYEVYARAR